MTANHNHSVIIAIDGPAASGKGTLARRLAKHFSYAHMDSGLLYRAVALALLQQKKSAENIPDALKAAETMTIESLADPALRTDEVAIVASQVAALPEVRTALIHYQRQFAEHPDRNFRGAVIDGRDIGTVIFPDANFKIFVNATVETRTKRRVKELRERGVEAIYARVLHDLKERDARDRSRRVAPLLPANDAYLLDTTNLDADATFAKALEFIKSRNLSDA